MLMKRLGSVALYNRTKCIPIEVDIYSFFLLLLNWRIISIKMRKRKMQRHYAHSLCVRMKRNKKCIYEKMNIIIKKKQQNNQNTEIHLRFQKRKIH